MNSEKPSFEQSLKQLEDIVSKMESGGLSLEESIQLYEKGIALKKLCQQDLENASLKIEKLSLTDSPKPDPS
ncbi:MAG: exodeoxyribonuclease VII small subunit [Rickettsiales bacterium]|nr:exodeoxyribonuclease VII small subunit [Rickettsiales bacterium]|tara:strand:+ start:2098 stop:2313 length:216 start_codon:yes stop_codon:yes gene_type:complete